MNLVTVGIYIHVQCIYIGTHMYSLLFLNFFPVQLERQFEQALKKSRGMVIHKMKPDGACLFRAVGERAI